MAGGLCVPIHPDDTAGQGLTPARAQSPPYVRVARLRLPWPTEQSLTVEDSLLVAPIDASVEKCDIIYTFSTDSWADAVRRGMYMSGDRLVSGLLDDTRVSRLLVANPFRSRLVKTARRLVGQRPTPFPDRNGRLLLTPLRYRRFDPTTLRGLYTSYARYETYLRRTASAMGMTDPVLITGNPFVAGFCSLAWVQSVTWYAWDDWSRFPPLKAWWPALEKAYSEVRARGRTVCAVSRHLLDVIEPTGRHQVVPNGVSVAEWTATADPPSWFLGLPRPRILYIGTIDDRLDIPSLYEVARRFAEGSIVLVGPGSARRSSQHFRPTNVHHFPSVGRKTVASLVRAADVCVLPHRRTPLTQAMSPLKLYEYLAGGRPVVASDLPAIRGVDERVVLVGQGDSFARGVEKALDRGPASESERQRFLIANSWERRYEDILELATRRD